MNAILSQEDAEKLLSELKEALIESIHAPENRKSVEFDAQGCSSKNLFSIYIFRGKINKEKVNYSARIKANNVVLLELHVGATNKHMDPITGDVISGSHWHIYQEGYNHSHAFPAENINSDEFVENTIKFLDKFNVIKKPAVYEQQTFF